MGGKQTKKLNVDLLNEKAVSDARKLQKDKQEKDKIQTGPLSRKLELMKDNTGNINNLRASQERHNTQPDYGYGDQATNKGGNAVT